MPLLEKVVTRSASDLHLTEGLPPMMRLNKRLVPLGNEVLIPRDIEAAVNQLVPEKNAKELSETGSSDFGYSFSPKARFRVSVYRQKGGLSMAMRLIPSRLLTMEEIGLPSMIKPVLRKNQGLVIVTGPTGSGKTTTLASMIDFINTDLDRHILTIEDPIEYYHDHKRSIITQREIGTDVPSFPEALRRGLRQDPDVILVGEMRDNDTIATAITAAETGHLVLGTLHTTGSTRTMDRIIDTFSPDYQEHIRSQLASSIEAVISQILLPRADGNGLVAAFEVMTRTPAVENHIRKSETFKITTVIQTSRKHGMTLLDDSICKLVQSGQVTLEAALAAAQNPADLYTKFGDS
ncbi:MAG: PilT/PilU family type 4a pilus ATPase [Planctomycetota bacterium]